MSFFADILHPVFKFLLPLDPLLAVGIVSLIVSLIITFIYKFTTNQTLMKTLKTELKELQAEMKTLRDKPDEMMKVQKQAMSTNMKYMTQSFKSTLYTFLPIIIIFAWMSANFAYDPLLPGNQFDVSLQFDKAAHGSVLLEAPAGIILISDASQEIVNGKAVFTMKGDEGRYTEGQALKFTVDQRSYFKDVIITTEHEYAPKDERIKDSNLQAISINYNKKKILPLIGWGWLGTYIIFSIVFSSLLRKWMKIY